MKYAQYSPFTGTLLYVLVLVIYISMTVYHYKTRTTKKAKYLSAIETVLGLLALAGDAYFWYTSSSLVPLAFTYNDYGEQNTIFGFIFIVISAYQLSQILNIKLVKSAAKVEESDANLKKKEVTKRQENQLSDSTKIMTAAQLITYLKTVPEDTHIVIENQDSNDTLTRKDVRYLEHDDHKQVVFTFKNNK